MPLETPPSRVKKAWRMPERQEIDLACDDVQYATAMMGSAMASSAMPAQRRGFNPLVLCYRSNPGSEPILGSEKAITLTRLPIPVRSSLVSRSTAASIVLA